MTSANWQPVKNSCQRKWRQSVQDIECELNGAKCRIFVEDDNGGGMYGDTLKGIYWKVERFENAIQILDMNGCIATNESTLAEGFELAKPEYLLILKHQ